MAVAKVIEITSGSPEGFEDAIRRGIETAAETVKDIRTAWVKEQSVVVADGAVSEFRVTLKVTFLLHGEPAGARRATRKGTAARTRGR